MQMASVSATDLAQELKVSKARVSQYVSEGKLVGCYIGDGRARRFDLEKVAAALGRKLHPGQMMGNGAQTRRAIRNIADAPLHQVEDSSDTHAPDVRGGKVQKADSLLNAGDDDRYELARTQKAEEEVRRMRRQNAEAEGAFVLATEVSRATQRLIAQEVAEFESVLRDAARKVADAMGVDFKAVRKILTDQWRVHRLSRAQHLDEEAGQSKMSSTEVSEDI